MLKATLKNIFAHKIRLALTALSIILGVGFIAGTYIYTDTIGRAFDGIFADAFEGVDIVVSSASDLQFSEGGFLPEEDINALAAVEGVDDLQTYIQGFGVIILNKEGEPLGGQGPPQFGANFDSADVAGGFTLRDGGLPVGPTEVVLDAGSAESAGFSVGDTVQIVAPTAAATDYTVVGIAGFGELDNLGGATFALFDLPTIQSLLDKDGLLSGASIQVTPGADVDQVIARIEPLLPDRGTVVSGQTAAEEQAGQIQEGLAFFNTFLLTFGFIALFVGSFIIANTFRIIVTQRSRELALLRALGATAGQVNRMVLIEALAVGLVASVVGIGVGFGIAVLLRTALDTFGVELPAASLTLAPRTIAVSMVVGVAITVLSAILPARRAARVPPVAALRDTMTTPRRKALTTRGITGAVVVAVGLGVLAIGLFANFSNGPPEIAYVGLGAAVVFIGVSILSPLVARPVARFIGWPFARLFGVPGKLARENAGRTPRRTSATAAALMIGITLVTLAAVMAASIRGTVDEILGTGIDADLIAAPANQFDPTASFTPDVADAAKANSDFADVTRLKLRSALVNGSETFIAGVENNFDAFFPLDDGSAGTTLLQPGEIWVAQGVAEANEWSLGDDVVIDFQNTGEQTFTLVGVAVGDTAEGILAITIDDYVTNFGSSTDSQVYAKLAAGVTLDQGKATLESIAEGVPTANVQTLEELQSDAEQQINQLLNLITGLLGLAVVIALIGVTNTMTLSVYERTREIGLLRAVGLSRLQTRRMIRSEASIISIFGASLGVAIGIFFGWAILQALQDQGFTAFVIPYGTVLLWIIVTGILGVIFALLPAWRASKLNVLEAISYE
ncbi:MAG: FtsX-like permease family protein [Acidimicrobiia bacterium]|nr:FtsX-like permease family protein [Acidimicrobiia bacterium]